MNEQENESISHSAQSEQNTAVEQITKEPVVQQSLKKEKDPKKIAAGKKLTLYNKKEKEKRSSFHPQWSLKQLIQPMEVINLIYH